MPPWEEEGESPSRVKRKGNQPILPWKLEIKEPLALEDFGRSRVDSGRQGFFLFFSVPQSKWGSWEAEKEQ